MVNLGQDIIARCFQLDPMTKLRNYMEENNLRLVDFFNQFDEDHSMSVTREEFKKGVEVGFYRCN